MPRLLLSPGLLLFLATSLTAGEMQVSQAKVVPTDTTAYTAQPPIVVAGDGFLVLWESRLWGAWPGPARARTYDGVSARQVIPVAFAAGRSPHAVWTGSEYLVLAAPYTSRFGTIDPVGVIVAQRLDRDGNPIEGSRNTLALARSTGNVLALAWDGAHALAAVQYGNAYALMRLDRGGALVEETPIDYEPAGIAARPGGRFFVLRRDVGDAVAAGGDRFAVVDNTENGIVVKILDAAGAELSRFTVGASAAATNARSVAWDGSAWITAYRDGELLCTARFTGAADVRSDCVRETNARNPFVAVSAFGPFLAWNRGWQVMTSAGLASTAMSIAFDPTAAVDEKGLIVAWSEPGDGGHRIRIGGIHDDRSLRPEKPLPGEAPQRFPRLIRSGAQTLLAWAEANRVFATRVDATGETIPPRIDLGGGWPFPAIAAAARDGGWLVAWESAREIHAVRLSANLDAAPAEDFGGMATQTTPAAAATRDGFLVVWQEAEGQHVRIVAEPLDANGRRVSGGIRIVEDEGFVNRIGIACNAERCLVAWSDYEGVVRGVPVRHDGTRAGETHALVHNFPNHRPVVVRPLDDGSFAVHRENDVVVWRGRTTLVYTKSQQVYALDIPPRMRSVRH